MNGAAAVRDLGRARSKGWDARDGKFVKITQRKDEKAEGERAVFMYDCSISGSCERIVT